MNTINIHTWTRKKALLSLWASPREGFTTPRGLKHWFFTWSCWCQLCTSLRTSPTPYSVLWNFIEVGRSEHFWWGLFQLLFSHMWTFLNCEFSEAGGSHAFTITIMEETPIFIIPFLLLPEDVGDHKVEGKREKSCLIPIEIYGPERFPL